MDMRPSSRPGEWTLVPWEDPPATVALMQLCLCLCPCLLLWLCGVTEVNSAVCVCVYVSMCVYVEASWGSGNIFFQPVNLQRTILWNLASSLLFSRIFRSKIIIFLLLNPIHTIYLMQLLARRSVLSASSLNSNIL